MSIHKKARAVILAGGGIDPKLGEYANVPHTSHLMFDGQTLLDRTLHVIKQVGFSGKPILVSSTHERDDDRYQLLPDQGSLPDNVLAALDVAGNDQIVTFPTDIPLIDASVVKEVLGRMSSHERLDGKPLDFCYSVCNVTRCEQIMPGMRHTSMTFKEGDAYTGGYIMAVSKRILTKRDLVEQVLNGRKNKREITKAIIVHGLTKHPIAVTPFLPFLWRGKKKVAGKPLATRAIPFEKAGPMVSAFTGLHCRVVHAAPQIACDIDNLEGWQLLQKHYPDKVLH